MIRQDGSTLPCPTCDGDGFVSYGDRHVENLKESCTTCGGRGWVPARTGETPQTSAQDGGLHETWGERRHTVAATRSEGGDLPSVGTFHGD